MSLFSKVAKEFGVAKPKRRRRTKKSKAKATRRKRMKSGRFAKR
jgi:hypothetical protein